jgi:hypothetical protein
MGEAYSMHEMYKFLQKMLTEKDYLGDLNAGGMIILNRRLKK